MNGTIQKPKPVSYEIDEYTVTLSDPKQIVTYNGKPALKSIVGGQTVIVTTDGKPELAKIIDDYMYEYNMWRYRNIPGYIPLLDAYNAIRNEHMRYDAQKQAYYDGRGSYPASIDEEIADEYQKLDNEYPEASVYLMARNYTYASNYKKVAAGHAAMELLENGGDIAEAKKLLSDWHK